LQIVMPKYVDRLKLYDKSEPLFHHYGIEDEISRIQQRAVPLPHGGSIVIDQTEAMVAIDVNSGNFRADGNAEETAYQINMTAAREIARQLRLRDLGGVIVNDFIDMREERHRRAVENALRDAVRRDRARTKILRMSAFGLVEMTRQRIRPSLRRSLYRECAVCRGTGHIKTVESVSIDCMRLLAYVGQRGDVGRIQLSIHPEIATYMQNHKRQDLAGIEQKWNLTINIIAKDTRSPEDITLLCWDANGDPVHFDLGLASSDDR
jgi:ribonuclease E